MPSTATGNALFGCTESAPRMNGFPRPSNELSPVRDSPLFWPTGFPHFALSMLLWSSHSRSVSSDRNPFGNGQQWVLDRQRHVNFSAGGQPVFQQKFAETRARLGPAFVMLVEKKLRSSNLRELTVELADKPVRSVERRVSHAHI